jgi:hypothetical protein
VAITNGYCTLAQVKAALRITDTVDDTLLEGSVESASRLIDGYCNRSFYSQGSAVRVYTARDPYFCMVDDFSQLYSLKTSVLSPGTFEITWNATYGTATPVDVQLEPLNAVIEGSAWSYDRLRAVGRYFFPTLTTNYGQQALVQLTANFGWSAVPKVIEQATIIQASRLYKRLDSPLGVAGFGDMGVMRISRAIDPDVAMLVDPYRKMVALV